MVDSSEYSFTLKEPWKFTVCAIYGATPSIYVCYEQNFWGRAVRCAQRSTTALSAFSFGGSCSDDEVLGKPCVGRVVSRRHAGVSHRQNADRECQVSHHREDCCPPESRWLRRRNARTEAGLRRSPAPGTRGQFITQNTLTP